MTTFFGQTVKALQHEQAKTVPNIKHYYIFVGISTMIIINVIYVRHQSHVCLLILRLWASHWTWTMSEHIPNTHGRRASNITHTPTAEWNSSYSLRCSVYYFRKIKCFFPRYDSLRNTFSVPDTFYLREFVPDIFVEKSAFFLFISKMNFGLVPHVIYGSRVESTEEKRNLVDFRGHFFDIWQSDTHTNSSCREPRAENERYHWQCFTVRNILLDVVSMCMVLVNYARSTAIAHTHTTRTHNGIPWTKLLRSLDVMGADNWILLLFWYFH